MMRTFPAPSPLCGDSLVNELRTAGPAQAAAHVKGS